MSKSALAVGILLAALPVVCAADTYRSFRADFSATTNVVRLSFSPGETCELRVAHDETDKGTAPSAWTNMTFVAVISNDVTSYDYVIPETWYATTGSLRFFLAARQAMPEGVSRRVQWVGKTNQCSNNGSIDTGVVPSTDLTTRLTYWLPKTATDIGEEGLFGISGKYGVFSQSYFFYWAMFGASGTEGGLGYGETGDAVHTVEMGPAGFLFDGANLSGPLELTESSVTETIPLFVRKTGNAKGSYWLRIHAVKMTKGDVVVRDMYPCVTSAGTGALYDTASQQVYPYSRKSMAELITGPDWGADALADAAALASAAVRVSRQVTEMSLAGGTLHLSFVGDFGKDALYLACDSEDRGADWTAWSEVVRAGVVSNGVTGVDVTIPAAWQGREVVLRAFLAPLAQSDVYDDLVEWIYKPSSSATYIDSGIVPDRTTEIRTTFLFPTSSSTDVGLYGLSGKHALASQSSRTFLSAFVANNATAYLNAFGFGADYGGGVKHTLEITADGVTIDGQGQPLYKNDYKTAIAEKPLSDTSTVATETMPIMGRRAEGSSSLNKYGELYLYSFDIRKGGEYVRRFAPCVKNGVAGLYDSVSNAVCFKRALSGSSTLVPGPVCGPEQPTGDVTASAAFRAARTVAVDAFDREGRSVTLAFSGADVDALLFALYDPREDRGTDAVADWPANVYLGKIAASATSATFGTEKIPAAWFRRGGAMRFVLLSAANFPFDAQLDYLASTAAGMQVIDTGICPDTNTVYAMRITRKPNDYAEWGVICWLEEAKKSGYAMSAFLHSESSGIAWVFFGRTGHAKDTSLFTNDVACTYSLRLGKEGLFLNDEATPRAGPFVGDLAPTFAESDEPIFLFARNNRGTPQKHGFEFKIHRASISGSEGLQRDFVPCSVAGKAKMYDRVSKAYFCDIDVTDSPGIVDFVGGPEVPPDATDAQAYPPTSWTAAQLMEPPGLIMVVR